MHSDILIVGAGLAGLHCAIRISEKYPNSIIHVLESYNIAGGRVNTYKKGHLHWEAGAGRIPQSHTLISGYCNKYGLTRFPISTASSYLNEAGVLKENLWFELVELIKEAIKKVPKSHLSLYTMQKILYIIFDKKDADNIMSYFPYRSELTTMRADLAFPKELSSKETFYGIQEGLFSIITGMLNELKDRRVKFFYNHRVTGLGSKDTFPMSLHCSTSNGIKTFTASKIIFALHSNALRTIRPFSTLPVLKHLKMNPLLRTYAIFPRTIQKKVWFHDLPRIVTKGPVRHVIPINQKTGLIMTSYTDGDDTMMWNTYRKNGVLNENIMKELRGMLPMVMIPNPLYMSSHYWEDGCTYWVPGTYDPVKESNDVMRPFPTRLPDIYICGESYSMKQAWMEGALEHADAMLNAYFFRTS